MKIYNTRITLAFAFTLALACIGVKAQPTTEQTCAQRVNIQLPYERLFTSSVAWSPDGHYLSVIYSQVDEYGIAFQQGLAVFDTTALNLLADFDRDLTNYASPFDPIYWSLNSERFAVANANTGQIEVIEVAEWQRHLLPSPAPREVIEQAVWSEDNLELAIVAYEPSQVFDLRVRLGQTLRIWNSLYNETRFIFENGSQVRATHFAGQWYFATRNSGAEKLSVFRLDNDLPIFEIEDAYVVDLASTNHQLLLSSVQFDQQNPRNTILQVWDIESGEKLFELVGEEALAYSTLVGDTPILLGRTASQVWIARNLQNDTQVSLQGQGLITPAPNGLILASVEITGGGSPTISATGDIYITNISTGETITTFAGDPTSTLGFAWSPDSLSLAVTGTLGSISVYSLLDCFSDSL
jgi:WD40 repeat protein